MRLVQIDRYRWEIPRQGEMRTRAVVYADQGLLEGIKGDRTLEQLCNVAALPGIVGPALAMPDAHQGYGMPIGGVAAIDPASGAIPPGAVGYDINCGVRLMRTRLAAEELTSGSGERLARVADILAREVPAGVGVGGGIKLSSKEMDRVLERGAAWAVGKGLGEAGELEFCEAGGALPGADPQAVSPRARTRGGGQVGTLGAGNHFVELARVDRIYDPRVAEVFGLFEGQLVLWIHSGSRGLGHQVCDDYLRIFAKSSEAVHPKDRQLIAAPPESRPGRDYLAAMAAAANFAFANRQVLSHLAGEALCRALGMGPARLGLGLVYDLAHNVATLERRRVEGKERLLWVLRKGATRALGPGHQELPPRYRPVGQPVLLPGDMGRASYVLVGSNTADSETFSSSAHGAGRVLSRTQAKKQAKGRNLAQELLARGIQVRARSWKGLAEEMPAAYKDASLVAQVMHGSGVAPKVARTRPLAVIKG